MMKTIQNIAASCFITAVAILSVISILGVWNFFTSDVIAKSFETLGLLALVSVIIIVAGHFVDKDPNLIVVPNPIYRSIRTITLGALIVSAVLLAFLGVCAIWDIITDKQILYKSVSSLAILAFSSFVIVISCLEREDSPLLKSNGKTSVGRIIGIVLIAWLLFAFIGAFR